MIVFGLSAASFYFIETPPRRALAVWRFPRIAAIGIGLGALFVGYGVTSGIWALQPVVSLSTVTRHAADWYPEGTGTDPGYPGCMVKSAKSRISGGLVWSYTSHRGL